jgi:hypothetical protein
LGAVWHGLLDFQRFAAATPNSVFRHRIGSQRPLSLVPADSEWSGLVRRLQLEWTAGQYASREQRSFTDSGEGLRNGRAIAVSYWLILVSYLRYRLGRGEVLGIRQFWPDRKWLER